MDETDGVETTEEPEEPEDDTAERLDAEEAEGSLVGLRNDLAKDSRPLKLVIASELKSDASESPNNLFFSGFS